MKIMKKIITILMSVLFVLNSLAQADSVNMTPGYAMDVFYSLENSTVQTVAGAEWTVALGTSATTASVYINDGRGVELFQTNDDIADFSTVDTTGMTFTNLYNNYNDWEHSAFEANATGHPNYGWGNYNSTTHDVVGNSIFIIKTLAGTFYKTMIIEKETGSWHYRYATLDNSFDTTIVYQASDLQDKNFAYLNMDNHVISDREPSNTTWDLLFTKYYDKDIPYAVTGVLSNLGIEVVEIDGVNPNNATYTSGTFSAVTKEIGSDWKAFDGTQYLLDLDRTFFVKRKEGTSSYEVNNIYKIVFTGFADITGKIYFNKELVKTDTVFSGINNLNTLDLVSIYPNPANLTTHLVLDVKEKMNAKISVFNVIGKEVLQLNKQLSVGIQKVDLDVNNFTNGLYFIQLESNHKKQTFKLQVKR